MTPETLSETVEIMQALRHQIVALGLGGLRDDEIQVREDYYFQNVPYEGCSIHDTGEVYDNGVIGFEDVGYKIAATLVAARTRDAVVTTDWLATWREAIRRRFQNIRLPVGAATGIRHHICRVIDGTPKNLAKFDDHRIQQLIIVVWNREMRIAERTRP